ncbi:isocitrate lyase [Granulosicoccus antarcticus]|uniref:Isocitrate lyase n=1 Tax=Granulosicoccus antarcticus IMCC3135 TaxID=1192854 RepID=A0A2Z2NIG4_9GAMM|nr:isocitrate lyase [Granulosicoccus antarcticus]ASJ70939.1 Isocitrate lyase [Granulosicoccus antarcticus IMCC3135]
MNQYRTLSSEAADSIARNGTSWSAINPESVARMQLQNRFKTGLDIARYTATIMRQDMEAYDKDPSQYTQSLGCWHGFIGQQKLISVKKHFGTTKGTYLYLSGWMVAAMRSEFGPLPDQSIHEKTSVSDLIEELYTFLKQADARELRHLFTDLDNARAEGNQVQEKAVMDKIDNFQTHVVPIIADIDAGFGNEEATYQLAKKMILAGACCLQIENQVSDVKQCGHQDGKVTVPHEDFLAKINAIRYAFLELGVEDGIIVARTDSLGAGLTQKIPVSREAGDLGDQYNAFIAGEEIESFDQVNSGDLVIRQGSKLIKPNRLPNGLIQFKSGTGEDRCVLDCITALQNGADLLWIETEKPHVGQIAGMVNRIREHIPNAKLVYNNSPSFNWTLNFRQQVFDAWQEEGRAVTDYDRADLMSVNYDQTELGQEADARIQAFQSDAAAHAGIFHHLITLPTYHTAAQSTDSLAKDYFGDQGMLAYVREIQRREIREGLACVKHQDMSGSNIGDDHKEYFSGAQALKASGKDNTMNQFG